MDPVQKCAPQVIVRLIYALHEASRPGHVHNIGVASAEVALDLVDDFRIFLPHHAILAQSVWGGESARTGRVFFEHPGVASEPIASGDIHELAASVFRFVAYDRRQRPSGR